MMRRRTFGFSLEPRGVPAYVPSREMTHDRADVVATTGPRVIARGVAVLPPLPAALFMLGLAEQVLDVPIRAVVGGLHLPVHAWGTPLVPQAVLGIPHWPWQPISERDATAVIDTIRARGPRVVALSGHDSTTWTFEAFERAFGDAYRTLRVGEELAIRAG